MAEAPLTRPRVDEDHTPPTRSYVDQLLKGNMSPSEISTLRSEIGESQDEDEARTILRSPASDPLPITLDDDDGGVRTAVHVYSADELAREAELRRRAALRAPVTAPQQRRVPASTVPPAPPSPRAQVPRSAPPAAPSRSAPPGPGPAKSVPPGASRSAPPTASRSAPPAASSSAPPPPVSSRSAPPTARSLTQAFLKAIGGNAGLLQIAVPPARLTELQLSREAGFVISRIDGMTSVEDILDLSPIGRVETLQILHELLRTGVLRVDVRP